METPRHVSIGLAMVVALAIVLGSLGQTVWATPTQDPHRQTVLTPTPEDDEDSHPEPILRKRAEPNEALPGEQVVITIEATNEGRAAVVGVVIVDDVPQYLEILSVTATQGAVHIEGQKVWVEVGVIGPEFWVEIVVLTRVREDVPMPYEMENLAYMFSHNSRDRQTPPVLISVPGVGLPPTGGGSWMVWVVCTAAFLALGAWGAWENYRDRPSTG